MAIQRTVLKNYLLFLRFRNILAIFPGFEQVKKSFQRNFVTFYTSHVLTEFLMDFLDGCF